MLGFVLAACVAGLQSAAADDPKSAGISADIVTTHSVAGGKPVVYSGRYYRSKDGQIREDSTLGAIIADTKQHTITLLNAQRKEAIVIAVPVERPTPPPDAARAVTPIGDGQHDGRTVKKARLAAADGKAHEVWTVEALGLVVFSRLEAGATTTTKELRNISVTEPDASLFMVPEGYSVTHRTLPEGFAGTLPGAAIRAEDRAAGPR